METSAKVYEITTPAVNVIGQYWLAITVGVVLTVAGVLCFVWHSRKGSKNTHDSAWRAYAAVPFLSAAIISTAMWTSTISTHAQTTVDHNIGVGIAKAADLHKVTPINGKEVQDGFVAIDSGGNVITGKVVPFAEDNHYQVIINDFK